MTKEDKQFWMQKAEHMSDAQLERLDHIMAREEKIDWEKEIPKYEKAVEQAENYVATLTMPAV